MKTTFIKPKKFRDGYVNEFNSILEFVNYLDSSETNTKAFDDIWLSSKNGNSHSKQTESYEEANDLLLHGWVEGVKKINDGCKNLKNMNLKEYKKVMEKYTSVAGFQPIVPAYLNGSPNNMINSRFNTKACKTKIINVYKDISYSCLIQPEKIIEESVIAVNIIKSLEMQGYRVNLYVIMASAAKDGRKMRILSNIIKLKDAKDKLNISKLAYPLIHPSFLRRHLFRAIEVDKNVVEEFKTCYGYPRDKDGTSFSEMILKTFKKDKYLFLKPILSEYGKTSEDVANKIIESYNK